MLTHNNFNHEVIIVGAGIAGIAASKILTKKDIPHIILEASNRVGGRAKKAPDHFGSWFDIGCSYLHEGETNPFVGISQSLNTPVKTNMGDQFSLEKTKFLINGLCLSKEARKSILEEEQIFKDKLSKAKHYPSDKALSSYLNMTSSYFPIFSNLLTGLNGVEPNLVSLKDFASVKEGQDFIIESGMANLIEKWGSNLTVKFNTAVKKVSWTENRVHIETTNGGFNSKKLLITVSNGILSSNQINFLPELPDYKIAAIRNLPMATLNKVGLCFRDGTFQKNHEGWYVVCSGPSETSISSVMSFEIRTKPKNHMIIFFGGKEAKELELSPKKVLKRIRLMLSNTFGHEVLERITKSITSSWGLDEYSLGSYSYGLPGKNKDRDLLRKSIDDTLFFAGEATEKYHYGTCHGAYFSGVRAAKEIIPKLKL